MPYRKKPAEYTGHNVCASCDHGLEVHDRGGCMACTETSPCDKVYDYPTVDVNTTKYRRLELGPAWFEQEEKEDECKHGIYPVSSCRICNPPPKLRIEIV